MAAKEDTGKQSQKITFELLVNGPVKTYHVGCFVNGYFYVHGGVSSSSSKSPLNSFHRFNISGGLWENLTDENSPFLSHHSCVAFANRFIVIIGGWNGKIRTSDVVVYDTVESKWRYPTTSGFNVGAGLSSHTSSLLKNGDILVIGREGSLRMQRRAGNSWILHGNPSKGGYEYSINPIGVSSRSGHSVNFVNNRLVVIGGRDDNLVDQMQDSKGFGSTCESLSKAIDRLSSIQPCKKLPCGRKHHVTMSCDSGIFLHGGETFDGRSREPVGEMYLLTFKPAMQMFSLGKSDVGLAGHVCVTDGESIFIHGGIGSKNTVRGDTYKIEVT